MDLRPEGVDSTRRPLHVFLCHSSSDKPVVRELYSHLKSARFEPWLDEVNILGGQEWALEIRRALRTSDVVLVCLSKSINKAGYLQREIREVLDLADEQPEGMIFLIPVRLEECVVPDRLRRWQWVNLFEENGYQKLLKTLRARAGLPETSESGIKLRKRGRRAREANRVPQPAFASSAEAGILINVFDGTRNSFRSGTDILYRIIDANQKQVFVGERKTPSISFVLPFHDNFLDTYAVIAFSDGYRQAGVTPVRTTRATTTRVDLMLVPDKATFDFSMAKWELLRTTRPQLFQLLSGDLAEVQAKARYQTLMEARPSSLAALLNTQPSWRAFICNQPIL